MKLLLVCIDGLRLDIALPEALQRDPDDERTRRRVY